MSDSTHAPTFYPFLRYDDAKAAIDWLERAFGLEPQMVIEGEGDTVAHAQLVFGGGIVMLGTAKDDALGMRSPEKAGGCTGGIYAYTDDPEGLFARATEAGAEVVYAPRDTDYGSREFGVRDREGHFWSFGTYRPSA